MHHRDQGPTRGTASRLLNPSAWRWWAGLLCGLLTGCAALTNPVAEGVPVDRLPPDLLGVPRQVNQTIPLDLLGQTPPQEYRLAPGDILGVWIRGILGSTDPTPPVHFPSELSNLARRLPPAVGYPVPVRGDGNISLPQVKPISVQGLTLTEAEGKVRQVYVAAGIFVAGKEAILVTLLEPRHVHVTVIRQEAGGFTAAGIGGLIASSTKRGTGNPVDLTAYENDVLTAIAQTGGMPGLDAYNEIIIYKGSRRPTALIQELENLPPGCKPKSCAAEQVIVIPLRLPPGEKLPIRPEDVLLQSGDVVFIEARDTDLFYTGGLLPAGEYVLPRDYSLDVVTAIAFVKGSLLNGAFGGSNLSGTLVAPGIGNPSPTQLTVLRRLPGGRQVPILVDLNRAMQDPRERILVQPGDVLILQESPGEALARYFYQTFFNFTFSWNAIHSRFTTGVVNVAAPDRPSGTGITNTSTI
ncbi:MAG: polysaccharide biosynthesis/export family protein, partial [Planctomycetes bacterium]|nr:polysaccharide biosynthesis/export family protein [Planctomycetota bacterium]